MKLIDMLGGETNVPDQANLEGELEITGLSCDSRTVQPGFLFAALSGSHHNGGAFISDALEKGAVAVLAAPGVNVGAGAELIIDKNPRRTFANMAARFYPAQPETIVAVTGTNGKTSVVHFLKQLWERAGLNAATMGTLGVHGGGIDVGDSLTTPDPVSLHKTLDELADGGVTHLGMEASSHGLAQYRLDGVRVRAAAFTNISRDHLDYHGTMPDYMAAKMRLFSDIVMDGGTVVVNADKPQSEAISQIARRRGLEVFSYGEHGSDIRLISASVDGDAQLLELDVRGKHHKICLSLAGSFQVENALCALGLAISTGMGENEATAALETLQAVPGRLQKVGDRLGAHIYVDYAHTPDALKTVLEHLKPHANGKLHVVFGAGGDRDPGKRSEMGQIASSVADRVIVTDDNPRSEDPATIRAAILSMAPGAETVSPRADAILAAIGALREGDVLVIAGKGHEQGQIIGDETLPFDDVLVARAAIKSLDAEAEQ